LEGVGLTKKKTIKLNKLFISLMVSVLLFSSCNHPAIQNPQSDIYTNSSAPELQDESHGTSSEDPAISSGSSAPASQSVTGELKIAYLDVGQGDSILIILPSGETVLIDAGEQRNSRDIIQYIKDSSRKDTLDYVIVTHPHADHMGGMAGVIEAFNVKNIYMPKVSHTTVAFENLLDVIEKKGLKIQTAKAGLTLFGFGNLKAVFLAPNKDSYSNLNNYSAVLMLSYNDKRFLFTGDAEKESESEILSSGYDVAADVLKVGHHGSHTASTSNFIKAVRPSFAVISVGKNNYGHPAQAALSTLNEFNAEIWRTDDKGTIIVTCDGFNITIKAMGG